MQNSTLLDVERSADGWRKSFNPHAEGALIRLPNGRVYLVDKRGAWKRQRELEISSRALND